MGRRRPKHQITLKYLETYCNQQEIVRVIKGNRDSVTTEAICQKKSQERLHRLTDPQVSTVIFWVK